MRKKLIDKDALAREIENLKSNLIYGACASQIAMETRCKEEAYNEVLSYLDTLEVKEDKVKDNWECIQDFIEKLGHFPKDCDWFRRIDYDDTLPPFETTEEFIKGFKNYMKEE